jgi:hypothetical protein
VSAPVEQRPPELVAVVPPQPSEQVQPNQRPELDASPQPGAPGRPLADAPMQPAVPSAETVGIEFDRFASLLSLVDLRLDQGAPGQALAVLADLQRLGPNVDQRAALAARRARAVGGLDAGVTRVVARLAAGEVHAAAALVGELLAAGEDAEAALAQLEGPGWRLVAEGSPWRQAEPLPKGRSVRVRLASVARVGTVADCRSDRATVRIAHGQGVTFPTVPLWQLEPVDPSVEEAVALGWACVAAGEVVMARCWAQVARLRGGGAAAAELAAAFAERE